MANCPVDAVVISMTVKEKMLLKFIVLLLCYTCTFCTILQFLQNEQKPNRSFLIDYENDNFLKDGKPYRFISGAIHYFRVHEAYWEDRLIKMKAAGLNAVEFYIPWNFHEPRENQFDFSGRANVTEFIGLAQKHGLDVIARMGPYTCGELDNGGLPWWLVKNHPDVRPRTTDQNYLNYVTKWFSKLFPLITPQLHKNGGPVVMLQVENEYGSFNACDHNYMPFLRDLFRGYVGDDVVLFTVDGGAMKYMVCGYTPGLYPTVDFGTNDSLVEAFNTSRHYAPHGPLVNMEFYAGWLDIWGLNHSTITESFANTSDILDYMTKMHEANASYNFYVFHGGTSFGYLAGSVGRLPCTTSYDYDAPLDESGDPTSKYFEIRRRIENLTGIRNSETAPVRRPKAAYGRIETTLLGSIFDFMDIWEKDKAKSKYPLTFEQLDFPFGFVMYETAVPLDTGNSDGPKNLTVFGVRDRGQVIVDGKIVGVVSNINKSYDLLVDARPGTKLQILVENHGRRTKGTRDPKGIVSNATLDGRNLTDWTMYPIDIEKLSSLLSFHGAGRNKSMERLEEKRLENEHRNSNFSYVPSFYFANFSLVNQKLDDTYFDPRNWSKGQIFINDFNLGRYWPSLGPQVTLYVPKPVIKPRNNFALLFELEQPGNCVDQSSTKCAFNFIDYSILDKVVPGHVEEEPFAFVP